MKHPKETLTIMTELVQITDANNMQTLHGGKMMYWMDICSAISAAKHAEAPCVTASVDNVSFNHPIKVGSLLTIEAKVVRAFKSSMEVHIEVWQHNDYGRFKTKTNEAYFTFVALDDSGKPKLVDEIVPETDREKELFEGAIRRRQVRLILGGKMKVEDANELRALFQSVVTKV
jgi:acyl-CoA hydrolase